MIDLNFPNSIEKYRVNPSDFEINESKKNIEGGYGLISFQIQKSTNTNVVVKRTKQPLYDDPLFLRSFKREVELLATSQHPAIVPFIGFSQDENYGYIYLKEIENGSLANHLYKASKGFRDKRLNDHRKYIITYGVACVMRYLHSLNRIHRDLKVDNILIDNQFHPYVADFGTAKEIDPDVPINQTLAQTTVYIMAPEFMEDAPYYSNTLELDVYAYGMALYEIWTGIHPFNNLKNTYRIYTEVLNGSRPKIPTSLSEKWRKLIEKCWNQQPRKRPTFDQIVKLLESPEFLDDAEDIKMLNDYKKFLDTQQSEAQIQLSKREISRTPSFGTSPVLSGMREEALAGDTTAMYNYVVNQFEGIYGEPDYDEIISFAKQYANRPNSTNKEFVHDTSTIEYYSGMSSIVKKDYLSASKMLKRAVSHGNGDAAYELARLIDYKKIPGKSNEIFMYYKLAADYGNPDGLKAHAYNLYYGKYDNRPNKKEAIKYFHKGSDNGDPELMYLWALRNEYGRDIIQNTKEAMRLLKLSAETGFSDAMTDYALHLFNGFNVPKDLNLAIKFFKKAALEKKNPEALMWYALMLSRDQSIDDENEPTILLKRCINTKEVPEAWAIYGRLLAEQHKISEALPNLYKAVQNGSLDAFLCLGEICENDPSKGDSKYYYKLASYYCHCVDTCGFITPIQYKIYHCSKCNIDICEGCAKHCHSGHKTKLIGKQNGFKCGCGQHGFEGKCTGEFVGETECYQHLYQCSTCSLKSDIEYICKNCAEQCHKGHKITDCGVQHSFCSCGMKKLPHNFRCHLLQYTDSNTISPNCSNIDDTKVKQRCYQCVSCGLNESDDVGICKTCALICHSGHTVIDLGVKEQCCCCKQKKKCSFLPKED